MSKPSPSGPNSAPDALPPPDDTLETGFYEAPEETPAPARKTPPLSELVAGEALRGRHPPDVDPQWTEPSLGSVTRPLDADTAEEPIDRSPPPPPRRPSMSPALLKVAVVILVVAVAGAAALLYRSYHRKQALAKGLAKAQQLLFQDTYAGYAGAADLLKSLGAFDAAEAGSLRAFALAMMAADYRDAAAAEEADRLLVEPERRPQVPPAASLARAAISFARSEPGNAAKFAGRPGTGVWGATIQGRVALLAGNLSGAVALFDQALSVEPQFPAALALKGDALRRSKDFEGARAAYAAALQSSPTHPRAAYGAAKLALVGKAKPADAGAGLERMLADRSGTPANERGRAALYLAALRGRAREHGAATAALDASGAQGAERTWIEKTATELELSRSGFHGVPPAPAGLQSASDDDLYLPPPPPPPEPPKAVAKAKPAPKKVAKAKSSKQKTAKSAKAAKAGKPSKPKSAKATTTAKATPKKTATQ